jgi:AcrR family transcriptional regulator
MTDHNLKPSELTREQLLDAAEKLFVERGLYDVSLRAILREAGQKNQSALQYHFGSREGLITAIADRRMLQLEARRSELVDEAMAENPNPDLRACCALLASAPYRLCREQKEFRDFLGLFGQQLLSSNLEIARFAEGQRTASLTIVWAALLKHLAHLDPALLKLRIENTYGMALLAISGRARRGGSFRGPAAELFLSNLADQIAAMLGAPVSAATQALLGPKKPGQTGSS